MGDPESPASAPATPTGPPAPAWVTKDTLDATTGAGRTTKIAAAAADMAASAETSPATDIRPPPLDDVHISVRPQRPKHTQATT